MDIHSKWKEYEKGIIYSSDHMETHVKNEESALRSVHICVCTLLSSAQVVSCPRNGLTNVLLFLNLVPITHIGPLITICNSSSREILWLWPLWALAFAYASYTDIHIIKNES